MHARLRPAPSDRRVRRTVRTTLTVVPSRTIAYRLMLVVGDIRRDREHYPALAITDATLASARPETSKQGCRHLLGVHLYCVWRLVLESPTTNIREVGSMYTRSATRFNSTWKL